MSAYNVGATAFTTERAETVARMAVARTTTRKPKKGQTAAKTPAAAKAATAKAVADATAPTAEDGLSVIVKWVPGEIIGAYTALVAALQVQGKPIAGTAGKWLALLCVAALVMTFIGGAMAFRKTDESGKMPRAKRVELVVRGLLSAAGLYLWSYIIPGSATNQSAWAIHNANVIPTLVPLGAVIFGLVAEFIVLSSSIKFIGGLFDPTPAAAGASPSPTK